MNNRGQTGGLVTALVFGIASLVIAAIIAFVIISTLTGANLLTTTRTTNTVANETTGFINETGYTLAGASTDYVSGTFVITSAINGSNASVITPALYTVSAAGVVTNATAVTWGNDDAVWFAYTNTVKSPEELSTAKLSANFSSGVNNVSTKIPTVLLVAAIILILAVLAILVGVWQKMRMGSGAGL